MSARARGAYKGQVPARAVPDSFGARLRRIRVAWGLTQGELAERLNTDQQMISLWERGKTQPSRTGAMLLASYLGLSVEAMLSGEGFTVPDMPALEAPDFLERYLPSLEAGSMAVVSLESGENRPASLRELKHLLDQEHKRGARIWVVVEGLESRGERG